MQVGGSPRIPVYNGTAAEMGTKTGMKEGDLFYTTDTKLLYTYDGAAWNNILAGITQDAVLLGSYTASGATGTLEVGSLSTGTYRALMIFIEGRNNGAGDINFNLRFNSDSGNNYHWTRNRWYSSATYTSGSPSTRIQLTETSKDRFVSCVVWVTNSATRQKNVTGKGINEVNATECAGSWTNTTDTITSVTIGLESDQFVSGSRVAILGIK